jgi:hypothetical protein
MSVFYSILMRDGRAICGRPRGCEKTLFSEGYAL